MRRKLFFTCLVILKLTLPIQAFCQDSGYIRIEYFGEIGKSYTPILFYLPGSIDIKREIFASKFEVTKSRFQSIVSCITTTKFGTISNALIGRLELTIRCNELKKDFSTSYSKPIAEIFDSIEKKFDGSSERDRLFNALEDYFKRLHLSGN
jgi:hypothetical protein